MVVVGGGEFSAPLIAAAISMMAESKSNSHFSHTGIGKTVSPGWLSHYGTICRTSSGQQRLRPGSGNLGRMMRAVMRREQRQRFTGDQGGAEEVQEGSALYLFLFWLLKQMVPYMQSGSVC